MTNDDIAIKVENVNKTFRLPHEKNASIKSAVVNFWRRKKGYEQQEALKDVSFEVKKGEFFGIVGRNGSGKSTLLKLLAGIYTPDSGIVQVNGKLTPFIELGVGFSPELTGRENVFLNGALLGFSRKEMEAMYADIVEFAELERFMDQKLKNYSSGMQVRLAFSIAIRAKSDILLIDEVLAVGDEAFQRKCFKYFEELKKQSRTVVFVTHDMGSFEKFCDSGILINHGQVTYVGEPLLISAEYKILNSIREKIVEEKNTKLNFDGSIEKVILNGNKQVVLKQNENLQISIIVVPKKDVELTAGISIIRSDGTYIAFHNSKKALGNMKAKKGETIQFVYTVKSEQLLPDAYSVDVALYNNKGNYIDLRSNAGHFVITGNDQTRGGIVRLRGDWVFHA